MPKGKAPDPLEDETIGEQSGGRMGRQTMTIMLDALERAHERAARTQGEAIEHVVEASKSSTKRVFLIVLVVLMLLAAVLGITSSIELPGGTQIGFDPNESPEPAPTSKELF